MSWDIQRKPGIGNASQGAEVDSDYEEDTPQERARARRVSRALLKAELGNIQRRTSGQAPTASPQEAAATGIASPTTALPHAERIQASFGPAHDVSKIRAHVGGDSAAAMGATAYATGDHVVFDKEPDLHTAAHEATHVIQQRRTVQLYGGVGKENDQFERDADAVADRVVAGESASDLLAYKSGNAHESDETAPDQGEQKTGLLEQALAYGTDTFQIINDEANDSMDLLNVPEVPKTDLTKQLIGFGASALLGAGAGAAATWFFGSITTAGIAGKAAAAASSLISSAVKNALSRNEAKEAASLADIRIAFKDTFKVQLDIARRQYIGHWPQLRSALGRLGVEQLEAFNSIAKDMSPASLRAAIRHQTFIAWTNFLARVKHGAMGPWDHWQENGSPGAIALPGAQPKPAAGAPDPARSNVAPDSNNPLLETIQRPMQEEAFGILEIFVGASGKHVIDEPGYRMRLDNVGPEVRKEFKSSSKKVRELPVNKIVHLCSNYHNGVRVDPPTSIASVLITADGYVRASNWAEYQKIHFVPKKGPVWDPTGFGDCMDKVIGGNETADCHLAREEMAGDISAFASAAQELPLTWLEV